MDCRVCAKLEGGPSPTADAHVLSKYLSANSGETAANPAQIRTAGHGRRGPWTHKAHRLLGEAHKLTRQKECPFTAPVHMVLRESTVDGSQPGVSKGLPGVLVFKRRPGGMRVSQPGAEPRVGKHSWETGSSCSWLSMVVERTKVQEAGPMGPYSS